MWQDKKVDWSQTTSSETGRAPHLYNGTYGRERTTFIVSTYNDMYGEASGEVVDRSEAIYTRLVGTLICIIRYCALV